MMLSTLWTIGVVETGTDLCMEGGIEGGREEGEPRQKMNANMYIIMQKTVYSSNQDLLNP